MIEINISLTADPVRQELIKGSRTVVIDVLRATTVITTSLANGAKWVYPVASIEKAWELKKKYPEAILGGERDAIKISGFDNGNSPFEYSEQLVGGKGIILTTTNGTKALHNSMDADEVIIAAFLNLSAVVDYLLKSEKKIHILCAGTRGEFSLDDFLCAGGIVSILNSRTDISPDDLSILAKNTWEAGKDDLHGYLSNCRHYKILKNNGFSRDLEYCLGVDTLSIVPMMDLDSGLLKA